MSAAIKKVNIPIMLTGGIRTMGQAESVRSCIEKLQQENRGLIQVKKQELAL